MNVEAEAVRSAYVCAYMACVRERERKRRGFLSSNLEPWHYQTPKCFVSGCVCTQMHVDTGQAVTQSAFGGPDGM